MLLFIHRLRSPIGDLLLVSDGEAVRALEFADCEERMLRGLRRYCGAHTLTCRPAPAEFSRAVARYFAGELTALDAIPVRTGGSVFQQTVWTALRTIPPGRTMSYGALAARLGIPQSSRAVGHANGSNPVSIILPCHRVIGGDGRLTGYGGGLERKRWLLEHEGAVTRAGLT